jgi:hypothetical protein
MFSRQGDRHSPLSNPSNERLRRLKALLPP